MAPCTGSYTLYLGGDVRVRVKVRIRVRVRFRAEVTLHWGFLPCFASILGLR